MGLEGRRDPSVPRHILGVVGRVSLAGPPSILLLLLETLSYAAPEVVDLCLPGETRVLNVGNAQLHFSAALFCLQSFAHTVRD